MRTVDILYVYLYACSVYLCLFACCVFIGLAAWNKMDDDDDDDDDDNFRHTFVPYNSAASE